MTLRTQTKALEALRGMAAEPPDHPAPRPSADPPERLVRPGRPPAEEETMQSSSAEGMALCVAAPGRRGLYCRGEND